MTVQPYSITQHILMWQEGGIHYLLMLLLSGATCCHPLRVQGYTIRKHTANRISHNRSHHHCLKMELGLFLVLLLLAFLPHALWCSSFYKEHHNAPARMLVLIPQFFFPIIAQPTRTMHVKYHLKMSNFLHLCYYHLSPSGHHHLVPLL